MPQKKSKDILPEVLRADKGGGNATAAAGPMNRSWLLLFREPREIIDRWYEGGLEARRPGTTYFKVRTMEGQVSILRYQSLFDAWSVQV